MGTFDENLRAYHGLNALNEIYNIKMRARLARATTTEEMFVIFEESRTHFDDQKKLYAELGKEMVAIMNKKWWQFWK